MRLDRRMGRNPSGDSILGRSFPDTTIILFLRSSKLTSFSRRFAFLVKPEEKKRRSFPGEFPSERRELSGLLANRISA